MQKLQFREEGTFTIVQFTDIHWQNGEPADLESRELMTDILEREEPDFVIFTGDIIHSERSRNPESAFVDAVSAVTDRGIPWAFVFGNHDAEERITREELMRLSSELPGCLAQPGPADIGGVGNYSLAIQSGANPAKVAAALYMFDSGSYAPREVGGPAWIQRDQIEWYIQESLRLESQNGCETIPSLAFFHIPLPEFNELWDFHECFGYNFEGVGSPRINTGLFHAMRERGGIKGVFVGHDHVNDYWGELYGIRLGYGRATGYNTYGQEGFPRGARIIRLYEDNRGFETWLRLEGGARIQSQPLHPPVLHELYNQFKKRMRK